MDVAQVTIPEVGQLTGRGEPIAKTIQYAGQYLDHGIDDLINNKQQVFANFVDGAAGFQLPTEKLGIAAPRVDLNGLSRLLGPVPDLSALGGVLQGNLFGGSR